MASGDGAVVAQGEHIDDRSVPPGKNLQDDGSDSDATHSSMPDLIPVSPKRHPSPCIDKKKFRRQGAAKARSSRALVGPGSKAHHVSGEPAVENGTGGERGSSHPSSILLQASTLGSSVDVIPAAVRMEPGSKPNPIKQVLEGGLAVLGRQVLATEQARLLLFWIRWSSRGHRRLPRLWRQ